MKSIENEHIDRIKKLMKERRVALKFKQIDAAEHAGVSVRIVQQLEQQGKISLLNFFKLMVVYKLDLNFWKFLNDKEGWTLEEIQRAETLTKTR